MNGGDDGTRTRDLWRESSRRRKLPTTKECKRHAEIMFVRLWPLSSVHYLFSSNMESGLATGRGGSVTTQVTTPITRARNCLGVPAQVAYGCTYPCPVQKK